MADLFDNTAGTPDQQYEEKVLAWIDERIKEGEALLRDEPAYNDIDKCISYIMGDQISRERPKELSNVPDNHTKNLLNQTVAALTDIHPLFGFKTYNPDFKDVEDTLVKLSQAWWINRFSDLKLAEVIKFAAGVGTGYAEIAYDASLDGGTGDITLRPLDPRDVIPIQPVLNGSVQDWLGLVIRSAKTPDELRVRFPEKAHRIIADNSPSALARTWGRARKMFSTIISPSAVDVANGATGRNMPSRVATCDVHTMYIKDRRLFTGPEPMIMGDPKTTWSYTVYPVGWPSVPDGFDGAGLPKTRKATIQDSKLYPRGRMVVATKSCILYDGPNPYWHGMFPVSKLSLDPWPWSLLGVGLVHDLMPIQDAYNEMLNGILDHIRKVLRPGIIADKKAVPDSIWQRLDTRLPGMRLKTNATAGKGVEIPKIDQLPAYTFEVLQHLLGRMDHHAGTPALNNLMQLQQVPGEDTIEKMQEAMSPLLRLKGRLLEYFLRDIGEMVKSNFFQFYTLPRRVAILGESGVTFNDFDFDPGQMIPAMSDQEDGYIPELDKSKPRAERAQWFHKNFTFTITPNSLLAISQISRKLMYMQLRSMQLMDRWTLWDVLEVPNAGSPPNGEETISDRLMAEMNLQAQQMMMQAAMGMGMPTDPAAGGGPDAGGPGRDPTFQKSPTMLQKEDDNGVPRQTISSSGSGGG